MNKKLIEFLGKKKILILGFGKEGISTYKLLIKSIPANQISIADMDENLTEKIDFEIDGNCMIKLGKNYLEDLNSYDVIIKSPGVPNKLLTGRCDRKKITSQTDLFLKLFAGQTLGITGTKGKSTTSSLVKFIFSKHFEDVILIGNIGVPPFDLVEKIKPDMQIVFEMSSHQLQDISVSPHTAVLLNLFQEHLDHYPNYLSYQLAKFNIAKFQKSNDHLVSNADDPTIKDLIESQNPLSDSFKFSAEKQINKGAYLTADEKVIFQSENEKSVFDFSLRKYLPGRHNLMNIMAAVTLSKIHGVPDKIIQVAVNEFHGLPHRLEFVGKFSGILFYNDSIATVPQATIQAVNTLKTVDTLIIGGMDRGVDYHDLVVYLSQSDVRTLLFIGEAGERIYKELLQLNSVQRKNIFLMNNFEEIRKYTKQYTRPGKICLLSPSAASYDMFKNFEERGNAFKRIAESI